MTTSIEWTAIRAPDGTIKGYTFNPWHGCVRVSPACVNCYAQAMDARLTDGHWGIQAPRRFLSDDNWRKPRAWNRKAAKLGVRLRVFCGSMCDWLEDRPDLTESRQRLFELIAETPNLDWLMLSKRPENLTLFMPDAWRDGCPPNVWLGTTAESQEWAEKRLPQLLSVPAVVYFVSAEPLLGPLTLREYSVDWVIAGSESGNGARVTEDKWVAALRDECQELGRAFFIKQLQDPDKRRGVVTSLPVFRGMQHTGQPEGRAL